MATVPGIIQTDPNLERRRQLAMAMMQRGGSAAPVQHWTQGANRIAESLLGAYNLRQAEQEQARQQQMGQESLQQAMAQLTSQTGGRSPMMAGEGEDQIQFDLGQQPTGSPISRFAQALAANPYTREYGSQLALQQKIEGAKQESELQKIREKEASKRMSGQFQGTGVEQQMLNILLDPNIAEEDPRKQLAIQRLSRTTTTATPTGTYIQPGYDLSSMTGSQPSQAQPEFVKKPLTGEQEKASGFYDRMKNAAQEMESLGDYNPVSTSEAVKGLLNVTASPENQRYKQAASDWIRAKLRKESGAVIGIEEMEEEYRTYFPVYGDSAEVIEQKERSRRQAENAMLRSAGQEAQEPQLQGRRSGRSDLRKEGPPPGFQLMQDAQGNRAYVGPNGEIREL